MEDLLNLKEDTALKQLETHKDWLLKEGKVPDNKQIIVVPGLMSIVYLDKN